MQSGVLRRVGKWLLRLVVEELVEELAARRGLERGRQDAAAVALARYLRNNGGRPLAPLGDVAKRDDF